MLVIVVVVGLAAQFPTAETQTCDLCTPKARGAAVVKEVVDKVNPFQIFPHDNNFLCRIAQVESKFGQDVNTFRPNYHGGIWQVTMSLIRAIYSLGGIVVTSSIFVLG